MFIIYQRSININPFQEELLHFKNTPVHRIVTDFVVQMGDVTVGDGTGGRSRDIS